MLIGLFLILYRNCDEKGFDRLYVSIKMAILIAGNRGRLFFRYSKEKKGVVEKLAESNKAKEQEVIDNLKQNYE